MALLAQALWHDHPQHYHFLDTRRMRFSRHDLPTINGFLASYRAPTDLRPVRPATPATISSPLRNATGSGSCSRPGRSRLRYTQRSHGRAAQRGIRLSRWLHWRQIHKACAPDSAYWAIPSSAKSIARRSATLCHGVSLYPPIARNKRLISIQIIWLTSFAYL